MSGKRREGDSPSFAGTQDKCGRVHRINVGGSQDECGREHRINVGGPQDECGRVHRINVGGSPTLLCGNAGGYTG